MRHRKVRARLLAASTATLIAAVLASGVAAASGGPSPFRHDLHRIDGRLRMAIEYGPAELGEGLSASGTLCRLAAKIEARGEVDRAAADWSALSQLVAEVDEPALNRIDSAFGRADSGLRALRAKYAPGWSDPTRIRRLHQGVAEARRGIRMLREAMAAIAGSLGAWEAHDCRGAERTIDAGVGELPAGVERVSRGMQRLWELAFS